MAETDPLLDPLLDDEDEKLLGDVAIDLPQSGAGPVPDEIDEIAPEVNAPAAVDQSGTLSLSSDSVNPTNPPTSDDPGAADLDRIAALAKPAPAPALGTPEDIEKRQGAMDQERAGINAHTAQQVADAAREADEDARLERADYLERRQRAEQDFDQRLKAFESAKIVDPRTQNRGKAILSVIFGGLGAAFRSAGGGDSKNMALAQLQQKWHDETELQKANIAALREGAVMARTRLNDVNEGRRQMMRDADARLLSKYNLAIRQGEAQLKAQGKTQAEIDADKRILGLRQGAAVRAAAARKADDDHALNMARIESEKARAERLRAQAGRDRSRTKGAGGGGGGGGAARTEGEARVAQHLIDNPGDVPGATRLAGKLGVDSKRLDKVIANTKGTESQNRGAGQGAAGLRAVEALEQTTYKPSDDEVQKWLNNQRLVYGAKSDSIKGLGLTIGQNLPGPFKVPSSEVEGLSPEGKKYFADVRRLMEPLGRAKSGAAISESEWVNFFNQYGPQSAGGFAAARKELEDLLKLSGVAGRTLGAGGKPAAKPAAPTAQDDAEALAWAKKNLSNPKARAILKANGL